MDKLRVFEQNLGFKESEQPGKGLPETEDISNQYLFVKGQRAGTAYEATSDIVVDGANAAGQQAITRIQQHDRDTLSIVNREVTERLQQEEKFVKFHAWLKKNGAKYPAVDYPVAFGKHGELIGLLANRDIPPQKAFLFIPQELIINDLVCKRDPICGPIYRKHPEIFRDHYDAEYLLMIVFVMHHMLIGEKSFWAPFWQIVNLSEMPMRWSEHEVQELQDSYLEREIKTFREEYYKEFDLIFETFREHEYEDIWPGITAGEAEETKAKFEPIFYRCFNTIVTRCFGWGLPKTSLIPFADCINHHNVDSTYEFICQELHEPLVELNDQSLEDRYSIDINTFIEDNRKQLQLDNPEQQDADDATYYTKSKMMFDISDFYLDQEESEQPDRTSLKLNKKLFLEDGPNGNTESKEQKHDNRQERDSIQDVRSSKLTNRSIHTIKKQLMREEALNVTAKQLMQPPTALTPCNDVWDQDYKSTSDEEDNDSSDEEEYGKVTYPKPRLQSEPSINGKNEDADQESDDGKDQATTQKKQEKPREVDVIMKLINRDKSLVRRDLEARLARVHRQQALLKKFRKRSNITVDELTKFDETEDYSWWRGIDDDRGVYFAMGTKFSSRYLKGDQLFNCYGRRTNRFLLVNYGFCFRNNKYNSLGFKVFVNYKEETSDQKDNDCASGANKDEGTTQQHQKVIRMKVGRLSLDLLQYLRANLVFTFAFRSQEVRDNITVSTPVDADFEILCLEQAKRLIESMLANKYPTSIVYDLKCLDLLYDDNVYMDQEASMSKEELQELHEIRDVIASKQDNLWRFKLALIHRVNQKEILHNQLKFVKILLHMMIKVKQLIEVASLDTHETDASDDFQITEKPQSGTTKKEPNKSLLTHQDFKKIYLTPCAEVGELENEKMLIRNRLVLRFYLQEFLQNQQRLFGYFL